MDAPRGADYLEALQFPAECFSDPELAGGEPELTPLGLPKVMSGNVAGVFKMTGASGRVYAVRCFVRRFDDLPVRYAALTSRLSKVPGTWRVGVEYQPEGIVVAGRPHPIVKMNWSDATPLLPWIERHLWDGPALAYVATRFVALTEQLRAVGIAHGDLQHGNILVAPGGDLRLVDYDGMYVPELARLPLGSNELGHRNYAHPRRTREHFGPYLDAFPSWVVYASLAALSIDPLLWGRLDGGDECLLFRAEDFADPSRSHALAAFDGSGDDRLRALADALRAQLARPVDDVEPLTSQSAPPPAAGELTEASMAELRDRQSLLEVLRTAAVKLPSSSASPDDVVVGPTAPTRPATPSKPTADMVEVEAAFGSDLHRHRRGLAAVLGLLAAVPFLGLTGVMPVGVALVVVFIGVVVAAWLVARQFHLLPAVQASLPQQQELAARRAAAETADARVTALTNDRRAVDADDERASSESAGLEATMRHREQVALQAVEDELKRTLGDLAARERELMRAEQAEQADALRALQATALDAELVKHRLVKVTLPGMSDNVLYGLALDDIRTAADIADVVVEDGVVIVRPDGRRVRAGSLTADDARMLLGWRKRLDGQYHHLLPTSLPPERSAAIREAYVSKRLALQEEGALARQAAARRAEEVRAALSVERDQRKAELRAAKEVAAARRLELDRDLARARKDAAEAAFRLTAAERDAGHARHLTPAAYVRLLIRR